MELQKQGFTCYFSQMIVALALLFDLLLGDPPNRWHPVAWLGHAIALGKRHAPNSDLARFRYGTTMVLVGTATTGLVVRFIDRTLPDHLAGNATRAILLKLGLAWQGLSHAAMEVQKALEAGKLDEARRLTSWNLVSRNTSHLNAGQISAASIESVAENLGDSVVAPLLYYLVGGLPAVWMYRFVNTADAMIGYRDAEHLYLGRTAARLDDVLNFVPSRMAALLIALSAGVTTLNPSTRKRAWQTVLRDHARTDSPNAGWPMSAMAGVLGVSLEKVGHYRLGEGPPPDTGHITRAVQIAAMAAGMAFLEAAALRSWILRPSVES